jgi:hypothetical protein
MDILYEFAESETNGNAMSTDGCAEGGNEIDGDSDATDSEKELWHS